MIVSKSYISEEDVPQVVNSQVIKSDCPHCKSNVEFRILPEDYDWKLEYDFLEKELHKLNNDLHKLHSKNLKLEKLIKESFGEGLQDVLARDLDVDKFWEISKSKLKMEEL